MCIYFDKAIEIGNATLTMCHCAWRRMISANPVVSRAQTSLGCIILSDEKGEKSRWKFHDLFCQKSSDVKWKIFPGKCLHQEACWGCDTVVCCYQSLKLKSKTCFRNTNTSKIGNVTIESLWWHFVLSFLACFSANRLKHRIYLKSNVVLC